MTEIQLAKTGLYNRDQYLWLEDTILRLKALCYFKIHSTRLKKVVGWVKRQRNPTKVRKCWVSLCSTQPTDY
jgi:hypothetical protein